MVVRKDTRLPVQCSVTYVLETSSGEGTIFNMSRNGCAIESDDMVQEGSSVSLQIMASGESKAIRVELGKVSWATRREFGVEFLVIHAESKDRLNRFLTEVVKQNAG